MKPIAVRGSGLTAEGGERAEARLAGGGPNSPGAHLLGVFGDDAALLQKQRAGEWSGETGPAAAAAAAHRGQERSDLIRSQRLVADAAVVVELKSDAE